MFSSASCENFTELLASTDAVPGGGGAAALCGALGSSLCSMAAGLTSGKKKFSEYKDELEEIIAKCNGLRKEFLRLIDADAEGFAPLAAAYSLPRDTPGYAGKMLSATLTAMRAPFEMMRCCCAALELIERLCDGRCSALLISDAGCAAALCRAALQCAAMNVFVNTKMLRGHAESDAIEAEAKAMLEKYLPLAEALSEAVIKKLCEVK